MKELVGIILLTVLVVFGSCNSNTNVSLVGTSPQLFDVCQVSTGNPDDRNKELFINELERKCKYPIEFQKNNLEAYVAVEYKTCLLYTSPSPRDIAISRMPSSA